jgi:hypothetical protein
MTHCVDEKQQECVWLYIRADMMRVDCSNARRLHLLYLINDWAHYIHRKRQDGALKLLTNYAPQMYAIMQQRALNDASMTDKLVKLMSLWQSNQFFDDDAYKVCSRMGVRVCTHTSRKCTIHNKRTIK